MKTHIISATLFLFSVTSFAQDIHFSQINYSPLTLNPGLAGANYDFQATLNYRNQWNSVAEPFQTIAASFDARLNQRNNRPKAHFAAGINFFNDQAGEIKISTNNANLTLAAHVIMNKNHTLGAGVYVGFLQRAMLPGTGRWDSQYNGLYYDPTLSSGEQFSSYSFSTIDAGAGLVYTYQALDERISGNNINLLNIGVAAYHLNRPHFSFINNDSERLYMRISAFVNGSFRVKSSDFLIEPGIYFHNQGNARELYYGMYGRYILKDESKITGFAKRTTLALGLFCRNQDALVAKAHFEWNGIGLGFAYDINLSQLTTLSKARGGLEIALRWIIQNSNFNRSTKMYRRGR